MAFAAGLGKPFRQQLCGAGGFGDFGRRDGQAADFAGQVAFEPVEAAEEQPPPAQNQRGKAFRISQRRGLRQCFSFFIGQPDKAVAVFQRGEKSV